MTGLVIAIFWVASVFFVSYIYRLVFGVSSWKAMSGKGGSNEM